MDDRRLTKVQRNKVFQLVERAKFEPAAFRWAGVDSANERDRLVSLLTYQPTGHYFRFDFSLGEWVNGFSLAWRPVHDGSAGREFTENWRATELKVISWLHALREEVDQPDLWATANAERLFFLDDPANNDPFTAPERDLIAQHLRTLGDYVQRTYELTATQYEKVAQRLTYLEEASQHHGRLDWKNLAASTLISIVLMLGLTPDRAAGLLNLAGQLFGPLLGGIAGLIGGAGP